jgi:transposase-like protein
MATKVLPSQRQFKQFEEQVILGQLDLPEVVRRGAQLMLQHAVELEMTEYLGREYYRNDTEATAARGRRNGYRTRPIRTGEGSLEIELPEARDVPPGTPRFQSKILEAYVSRTESLDTLITRMYVAGMSTRDIETAFVDLLSGHGVSRSTVSRITERLNEDLERFRTADLSGHDVLYLILDGTYIKYRVEAERKEPILVAYGYRTDGKKVLLHVGPGNRESYDNWKTFLHEMVVRGLKTPLFAVSDGNPGVIPAIEEVFPCALRQRCQRHRLKNILGKAPKEAQKLLKAAILEAYHADTFDDGLRLGREAIERFRDQYPSAMACLEEDFEACLQVLRLPKEHRRRMRTSNGLERLFGENRRRVKVIPHFFTEKAGIKLVYATLVAASQTWRGVTMTPEIAQTIDQLWEDVYPRNRIETWAA